MHEIVVISGKGGTGKTSLTGAFASLARNAILCDLDVDAPDLHILLAPEYVREEAFISGFEAHIDPGACTGCAVCADMCRYGAVVVSGQKYTIDALRCEGCGVCVRFCPAQAVSFTPRHCGQRYISSTRFGTMVHAQLFPGQENSGRLVSLLRREARDTAKAEGRDLILCDGAPGIGCPVISSLSGTHLAVIVTEPTPSGRHDLDRVGRLCEHFRVKVAVIVNKYDLNQDEEGRIQALCRERGYEIVARLPHDPIVTGAMVARKVVTEMPENPLSALLVQAWSRIEGLARAVGASQGASLSL